jgi:hypothetical protein
MHKIKETVFIGLIIVLLPVLLACILVGAVGAYFIRLKRYKKERPCPKCGHLCACRKGKRRAPNGQGEKIKFRLCPNCTYTFDYLADARLLPDMFKRQLELMD